MERRRWALSFVWMFAAMSSVSGCIITNFLGGGSCESATTCTSCASRTNCGWCDGVCVPGNSSGPAAPATNEECVSFAGVWRRASDGFTITVNQPNCTFVGSALNQTAGNSQRLTGVVLGQNADGSLERTYNGCTATFSLHWERVSETQMNAEVWGSGCDRPNFRENSVFDRIEAANRCGSTPWIWNSSSCPGASTSGCAPACASNQLCVTVNGANPTCRNRCVGDAECSDSCCITTSSGARACAPLRAQCGGACTCGTRVCVPNSCGEGTCGTCPSGTSCNSSGQCRTGSTSATGTQVSSCLTGLSRITASNASWHAFPSPFNGLDYKVYWSTFFEIYEVIFRNRFQDTIHFNHEPTGGSVPTTTSHRVTLRPGQMTITPGITVRNATDGGRACILVDGVRFGTNDTGPYR